MKIQYYTSGVCRDHGVEQTIVHNDQRILKFTCFYFFVGKIKIQDILACSFLDDLLEVRHIFSADMYYFGSGLQAFILKETCLLLVIQ